MVPWEPFPNCNVIIWKRAPGQCISGLHICLLWALAILEISFQNCLKLSNTCLVLGPESEPLIHELTPMSPGSIQVQAATSQAPPRPALISSLCLIRSLTMILIPTCTPTACLKVIVKKKKKERNEILDRAWNFFFQFRLSWFYLLDFQSILCVLALGGIPCLHLLCRWLAAPFSKIHPPLFHEKRGCLARDHISQAPLQQGVATWLVPSNGIWMEEMWATLVSLA